jgi:hypothetical protein
MKTINTLLLAGAVALGFTLTPTAKADEPFLSPKAAALRHDFRTVPSTDTSPSLVSNNYLGAAAKTEANHARVGSSGGMATPNLVSGNYLGAGVKNPYARTASFQGAPLIANDMSGMVCEAGCTMACCTKK